jgi:hypothetical protein
MSPFLTILTFFLIGGFSLIVGAFIGMKVRDKMVTTSDAKKLVSLPPYWLIYDISQDAVTGLWNITAVSLDEKDERGVSRVITYSEADTLFQAYEIARHKIKNKDYLDVKEELSKYKAEDDAKEVIDTYISDKAKEWEDYCENPRGGTDIPGTPGGVSYQMIIDELRSRIKN